MNTCPIATLAAEAVAEGKDLIVAPMEAVGLWHTDLGALARNIDRLPMDPRIAARSVPAKTISILLGMIAEHAAAFLVRLNVEDPEAAFVAEYERAAVKHPGMTLDADNHTDESRFYALAEEVGEVAASLTYDNALETGHSADTITEVTQVGALALAWLTRYQDGGER